MASPSGADPASTSSPAPSPALLPASPPAPAARRRREAALALAAALFVFLYDVGGDPPDQTAQARVPVAARAMAREGLHPIPELGGRPWAKKPPLAIWLEALSMRAFGESLAAASLPGGLLAAITVAVVALRGGLLAGLILMLSPRWTLSARGAEMDIVFASLTAIAILLGLAAIERRGRLGLASQVLLGLALIVKGPLCLLFAALAWGRKWLDVRAALVLVPGLAWFLWARAEDPQVLSVLFGEMGQAVGAGDSVHDGLPHFYLLAFLYLALPAAVLILAWAVEGAIELWRERRRPRLAWRAPRAGVGLWLAGGLIFLSAMTKKQTSYALPLYPALALVAAEAGRRLERSPGLPWIARGLGAAVGIGGMIAALRADARLAAGISAVLGAALVLWVWRARGGLPAYRRALLGAVPIFAVAVIPLVEARALERSLAPVGAAIAAHVDAALGPGARERVAVLGGTWETLTWGFGADLPVVHSAGEALDRGRNLLFREVKPRAEDGEDTGDDDVAEVAGDGEDAAKRRGLQVDRPYRVVRDWAHPGHRRRRLELLELTPAEGAQGEGEAGKATRPAPGPAPGSADPSPSRG